MTIPQQSFCFCHLPAATFDSYRYRCTLTCHVTKSFAAALQHRLATRKRLPSEYSHVCVLRIKLDAVADTLGQFGGGERGTASEEGFINQLATLGVIQDRPTHQLNGFLRGMIELHSCPKQVLAV
jgi:hypothetical protein